MDDAPIKYALMVAGGSGSRMGNDMPKQFIPISGKPILMHTMERFLRFDPHMELILVLPESHTQTWNRLCSEYGFHAPHRVALGGKERFYSVRNGLNLISGEGIVFIHDGVRPLVSNDTLERCFQTAVRFGNALPVVPVSETVRYIEGGTSQVLDRSRVVLVQTPQTFRVSLIREAYRLAYDESFTDDASVLERSGHTIHLTEGNRENIKITWPSDLLWAESVIGKAAPGSEGKY